ncbi:hybrid sensor histidine kinase/response regulator [Methylosinus sp. R-45379]|uniref:ATP-binding protein n=1 Tax=unclassified Methylosinus TaxID=2624500 RepID=UPI000465180C|nr:MULTISPECIES: ATP-binding protein [unclassified Methylosinus]OAI31511.1 hybrid sensor histidine kinase/response regulator [Methylosinus sp. R-45379]TDX66567.1 phospho-acceptor domain-containing protein [Methylosinus sp. sav-2]
MSALSEWLFGVDNLTPHGFCLLWEPGLIWLFAISDGLIALAYFSIPLALVIIGQRRADLVFRPLLWLFAAFILLCGATHWLDVVTLWKPVYGVQGIVKAATALASLGTSIALWWWLPSFLALPSPDQLRRANAALLESEERLAHAQKMEAIGQLTGGIAHDFNNVLQVVIGSLGVIERQLARGRAEEIGPSVAAIRKAASSASNLIDRLLAFSRRQTLLPRVIEPDRLVVGLEDMLRRTLGSGVELDLRLGRCRRSVVCDPSQLESALLNLAINARDAMPAGGVLEIATADRRLDADPDDPDATPGDYVEIRVKDNGAGMSREVLAHVFEPFFTTKPTGRGTGLGLSQIYGFVKQSGGFVRIDSAPGKGTSVRLYLPGRDQPSLAPGEAFAALEVVEQKQDYAAPCGKTLLVEDQLEVRMQIADALEEMGCDVIEADDGNAGLKVLESGESLRLLVTDVGLPGVSGRHLAEAARAAHPDLPILLITGYAGKSLDSLDLASNIEVLRKPFTLEELAARVKILLARAAAAE